jgi:endonuclease YncB( thermonuclease family)
MAAEPAAKDSRILVDRPEQFELIETGVIKKVLKPDIIILGNNNRYRLDNVRIPALRYESVANALNNLLLNKTVNIYAYPGERDSSKDNELNDLPIAHVVRADGIWIQKYLIEKGYAWVFSSPHSRRLVKVLYKSEDAARRKRLGLWGDPRYPLRSYKTVGDFIHTFQVVQGRIAYADNSANEGYGYGYGYGYFHFAEDFKEDFTIRISPENLVRFQARDRHHANTVTWVGKRVRIRGWVEEDGGPLIELTHPEQIEFIDENVEFSQ